MKKQPLDLRNETIYIFEDRLVRFAGESVKYTRTLPRDLESEYYRDQLIRSSGSSALNYGEAQGTITNKDFLHKSSISRKELKESRATLKVLAYLNEGDIEKRNWLLEEVEELVAICSKMINNKR